LYMQCWYVIEILTDATSLVLTAGSNKTSADANSKYLAGKFPSGCLRYLNSTIADSYAFPFPQLS